MLFWMFCMVFLMGSVSRLMLQMQIFMASKSYSMGPPILSYFLWYVPGGHQSYHMMSTIIVLMACITGLWLLYLLLDNP